jgi:hypothetical protein
MRCLLDCAFLNVGHDHVGAGLRERGRDAEANTGRRAGHDCCLAGDVHVQGAFLFRWIDLFHQRQTVNREPATKPDPVAGSGGRVQRRKSLQQCLRRHGKIALGEQRRIGSGSLRSGVREPLQRRRVSDEVDRGDHRSHAPNSMTITAVSDTHGVARTRASSVVLPLPRKPRHHGSA